jgi:hypothetical protein
MLGQSETSDMLKIKILNCNKKEQLRDLQRAPEFDQSALFKKVYEEEFGIFGGEKRRVRGRGHVGDLLEQFEVFRALAELVIAQQRALDRRSAQEQKDLVREDAAIKALGKALKSGTRRMTHSSRVSSVAARMGSALRGASPFKNFGPIPAESFSRTTNLRTGHRQDYVARKTAVWRLKHSPKCLNFRYNQHLGNLERSSYVQSNHR